MKNPINKIPNLPFGSQDSNWIFRFTFLFILFASNLAFSQFKIPKKPSFIPPIIDSTETLSSSEIKNLYDKLRMYSDSTSTEIFVMIVPTTQGQDISRYATELGQTWKIGQKGKDNGVVFLIAKDDRKMTIQTGYGVEHLLTDALSRRVIEQVVKPEFKNDQYYAGIDNGTNTIFKILKGEFKNTKSTNADSFLPILIFIIFLLLLIFIISKGKNKGNNSGKGGGFSGPDLMDIIILSNLGRSSGGGFGGGFGGSSGGGFGGFGGGGSFGGGGASGSW